MKKMTLFASLFCMLFCQVLWAKYYAACEIIVESRLDYSQTGDEFNSIKTEKMFKIISLNSKFNGKNSKTTWMIGFDHKSLANENTFLAEEKEENGVSFIHFTNLAPSITNSVPDLFVFGPFNSDDEDERLEVVSYSIIGDRGPVEISRSFSCIEEEYED